MPTNPDATVSIDEEAGALAGGTGYCTVISCVEKNADLTPRVFSSWSALVAQHGYSPGASYVASHVDMTKLQVLFVGVPTATPGVLGRQNSSGVTGTSVISVASGSAGYLEETDAIIKCKVAGTIGVRGIVLTISFDGGVVEKNIALGTANSYTVPYLGIVLNFGAGTLLEGDVFTFATTAPMWDADGIADAKLALVGQQKPSRSWVVIGDVTTHTEAGFVVTAANSYETSKKRFVVARVNTRDRLPQAEMSRVRKNMTGTPTLTFAEVGGTGDTVTRSAGSWIADGYAVGDTAVFAGTASNNVSGPIASLTATVLTYGTTDLAAEGPVSNATSYATPTLTFAEVGGTGDTVTRSSGSWLADGFRVADIPTFGGTASNNVTGPIASLSSTVLTFGTTDLAAEVIGSYGVTCTTGETMAAWVSANDAEFSSIDAEPSIDIATGRLRTECPITRWEFRRPVAWAASIREYQRDIHCTTWQKDIGPLKGFSMLDKFGRKVEYDESTDGGALAARFTCAKTWNSPEGPFIAMSLTRDTEGSPLQMTHNMYVANVCCTVVQSATENFVGRTPQVDDDGHLLDNERSKLESEVNTDLAQALLTEHVPGQGPRASKADYVANPNDVIRGPGATVTGVTDLDVNGTIVHVNTVVKVK